MRDVNNINKQLCQLCNLLSVERWKDQHTRKDLGASADIATVNSVVHSIIATESSISKMEFGSKNPKGQGQKMYRAYPVKTQPAAVMYV